MVTEIRNYYKSLDPQKLLQFIPLGNKKHSIDDKVEEKIGEVNKHPS